MTVSVCGEKKIIPAKWPADFKNLYANVRFRNFGCWTPILFVFSIVFWRSFSKRSMGKPSALQISPDNENTTDLSMMSFILAVCSNPNAITPEKKLQKHEATIMSEVPGWQVGKSQYFNSSRWTPEHVVDSMKSNMKK